MTELSGLQIFKYLPGATKKENTNCKKCGFPTCMAFALNLAKNKADVKQCPYMPEALEILWIQNNKQPQNTVEINGIKIGGENVLYRHEKTFNNKCAIAIIIDTNKPNWEQKLETVKNFQIKRVNEILKVDLIIIKSDKKFEQKENIIWYNDFIKLPLKEIQDSDFATTSQELIKIRKKAILEKDENYSKPVYVYLKSCQDKELMCAKSAYYICKYANMLVFEDFDEHMLSALMTLRQNIYTDPQKPLQVESGIYEFNNPDKNSLIFLTTNFALTYFAVANELENLDISSYLIVTPSDGMSVLTAWSAEKITAETVAKIITNWDMANKIKNKKIIIPGLLSHMKKELEAKIPDFEFIVGTVNAFEIGDFVKNLLKRKEN